VAWWIGHDIIPTAVPAERVSLRDVIRGALRGERHDDEQSDRDA
jgi:hypothetical protein